MPGVRWILASVAVLLAVVSGFTFAQADKGLEIHRTVVSGVPLEEVRVDAGNALKPGIVVAHGYSASSRLMAGFADTFARHGFIVVLLDFSGHGAHLHGPPNPTTLGSDLDIAVNYLRERPGIDPRRISLLGHSMGAEAVTRYAASHPDIASTVAISLPVALDALPDRMLLVVGAAEFRTFHAAAEEAVASSTNGGRTMTEIPNVEHISVLFAPRTHDEILAWLGAEPGPDPASGIRILAAVLMLLAFGLGFYPVAVAVLGVPGAEVRTGADQFAVLWVFLAGLVGAAAAKLLPLGWFPIAVTNYVAVFGAVAGLVLYGLALLRKPAPLPELQRTTEQLRLAAPILIVYAILTIAIPLHLGLAYAIPWGHRLWLLPLIVAGFAAFTYGTIRLTGGVFMTTAIAFLFIVIIMIVAAFTGAAPSFLVLILPLLAVLLAWQAAWMTVMTRLAAPVWLTVVVCALLPAWPAALALPVLI